MRDKEKCAYFKRNLKEIFDMSPNSSVRFMADAVIESNRQDLFDYWPDEILITMVTEYLESKSSELKHPSIDEIPNIINNGQN